MKLLYPLLLTGSLITFNIFTTEKKQIDLIQLPLDIVTTEITKQLLNVSNSRNEALTLLSNYARINKPRAQYINKNKDLLQKLLDQKFGLSLTSLASGNYDDPSIKEETLKF